MDYVLQIKIKKRREKNVRAYDPCVIKIFLVIIFGNNFFLKYQLCRKTARDKNCLFSSHRTLRIFSEFFINFLVLHFL